MTRRRGAGGAPSGRPSRAVPVMLTLAAVAVMSLDVGAGDSPLDRARSVVADVVGPAQGATASAAAPFAWVGDRFGSGDLTARVDVLEEENARLRAELGTVGVERARGQARDVMADLAQRSGFRLVTGQVVGIGPAQSYSRTVTLDLGTDDGVDADMTVLDADGLVGRVLHAGRTSATVLLLVDEASVVGGRLGSDLELGFARGDGDLSDDARLTLSTLDPQAEPRVGDPVLTWGSDGGTPYVAGVPIGRVESVESSPIDQTTTAVVAPYVDFSALDLVSVVVGPAAGPDGQDLAAGSGGGR